MPDFANAVVGYGAIIPIERFVQVFPGTFVRSGSDEWQPARDIDMGSLVLYYSQTENGGVRDLFLTSMDAIDTAEYEGGRIVDYQQLLRNAQQIGQWIVQTFPGIQPNIYLYAYSVFD